MGRLDNRVAIVTGGAHGERAALGAAFALSLAKEGAKVVVADRVDTASVVREIEAGGGSALGVQADVRDEASIGAMVAETIARFGQVDILVNNAAVGSNIPPVGVEDIDIGAWDDIYAINVRGPFLCVKAVLPHMRARGYGKIINIGSTMMYSGAPKRLHYVSAKGAVLAMSRALARELGPSGICVNTLAYGLITSKLNEAMLENDEEYRAHAFRPRAMPVHLRAADVTGALLFLASSDSDHVTGQCLMADPGSVMN
jgi:NAD(P)-dependent dehydrogenase (short-subunit alcohol dehydrogenase family)